MVRRARNSARNRALNDTLIGLNRIGIAVFGLLAVAVLSIFNLLLDTTHLQTLDIGMFDRGVSLVRPALPSSGVVGFYTDASTDVLRLQEYYLAQYALAPVVVANDLNHKLVVASLRGPQSTIPDPNLELVRNFGNGIRLFRNRTK